MADIEFIEGEFGDNYDMSLYNKDGTTADITSYTAATLYIKTTDLATIKLSKALTIVTASPAKVRWVMASGDTSYNSITPNPQLTAQIELTGTGLDKRTYELTVFVSRKV
jgi:hypothetical protein